MLGSLVLMMLLAQQPGQSAPPPEQPWPPAGVYHADKTVRLPRVVKEAKPKYTADARKNQIHGVVGMEVVVLADGKVGAVRVTRSLDTRHGLDEEAVAAVKQWRFEPGRKDGLAVPVMVEIEMTFTLRAP